MNAEAFSRSAALLGREAMERLAAARVLVVGVGGVGGWCAEARVRFTGAEDVSGYDVVADAIDSVACKAALILKASEVGVPVVSSMGAALRTDPSRVRVTRFEKVSGDGLARALRRRFRAEGRFPGRFDCVWSDEPPRGCEVRGSLMQVTAAFGMCLAARVVDIVSAPGGFLL